MQITYIRGQTHVIPFLGMGEYNRVSNQLVDFNKSFVVLSRPERIHPMWSSQGDTSLLS